MNAGALCPAAEVQVKSKTGHPITRRQFLAAAALAGAGLAAGCRERSPWQALSAHEAQTLAALCDQIIPADDYPSASQAGVVTYIDHQLTRHYKRHRAAYAAGLEQADRLSASEFGVGLAASSPAQQTAIAHALEQKNGKFFEMVRAHTFEGYYGSPRHGGNRDAASWRMLGLDEPPIRGRATYDLTASNRS